MSNIRWRLVMALLSLAASLALTAPAAAAHLPSRQIGEIWPNGATTAGDTIWPNSPGTVGPDGSLYFDNSGS